MGGGSLVLNSGAEQSLGFSESSEFISDSDSTIHGWRLGAVDLVIDLLILLKVHNMDFIF